MYNQETKSRIPCAWVMKSLSQWYAYIRHNFRPISLLSLFGFKFTFLEKIMAEASATPHWRSWRNLQVIWLIDEVYNTFWEATKFNTKRLLDLGDELDDESLFHFSLSFPSWKTLKEATDVDKKELFKLLKDNSVKTFTTRIIFMKMIYSKDKSGIYIWEKFHTKK